MSVISTKIGTKAWSDGRQNEITKAEGVNQNSAEDLKRLGGQDVGEVLNKIADPNYVDPNKKPRGVGSDKLDKDAFMKLMLAQMKNQDPTNPLKSHEMAAQLAQFSGLEQMQNMNTTLSEIQKGQKPTESFQALNFIGKAVSGDSAKIMRMKGDKEHDYTFNLPADAKDIEIKVKSPAGEVIRKADLHDKKAGENKWVWNGKGENGAATPVGEYTVEIEAKDSSGKKLAVKTDFSGVISGVSYNAEGPVLMVGNQAIKMKDVKRIIDPSLKNNDQKSHNVVAPDLKAAAAALQNESNKKAAGGNSSASAEANDDDKGAPDAPVSQQNLIDSVGMSSGMMEKLKRDSSGDTGPVLKPESKAEAKADSGGKAPKSPLKSHGSGSSAVGHS